MRHALALASAILLATAAGAQQPPAPAAADTLTINVTASADASPFTVAERAVPAQLSPAQRDAYRRVFRAIEAGRLAAARSDLAAMAAGPLHPTAQAQLLLAEGTGAGLTRLLAFLEQHPDAPQSAAVAALARRAGAQDLPPLARTKQLVPVRLTPSLGPRSARSAGTADSQFVAAARERVAADDAAGVLTLINRAGATLSAEVRSEWAQRAAWDAYLNLDDPLAGQLGMLAGQGSSDWAALGRWVAGLAGFRQNDCEAAARQFDAVGQVYAAAADLRAAAAFWAARSHVRCGRPHLSSERLRAAVARDPTGFYGLLAARALGVAPAFDWREPDFIQADWTTLNGAPGAKRAAALAEIDQVGLADRELRHLAATTDNASYEPILRLAARLNLPATQYWLAQNPPPGMMPPMAARFPTPDWRPLKGWRVDRSLVFAHALQESKFITAARSGAGAQGPMQIMPGTARDIARALDMEHNADMLSDPTFSVEYGQSYLEYLRDSPTTGGQLPKVVAAYNAGPGSVAKWSAGEVRDNGDVLLFMESIPFRETRHYVEVVLRNYWLYQMKASARRPAAEPAANSGAANSGAADWGAPSMTMVAQNQWPRFPASVAGR